MKQITRNVITLLMVLCIILPFTVGHAFAADEHSIQHWNIMLVIDDTKSMYNRTDPDGLRYEAINSFFDTLWNKGDYVGVILFRANDTADPSDDAMASGIVTDTWEKGTVALENNKTNLKKQIKRLDVPSYNFSDLGTALLTAEQHLEQACSENGLPGAIYVLTDGNINLSYNKPLQKARDNLEKAIVKIKDNGYVFCGTFLNPSGEQDAEFRDTITRANSFVDGDLILGRYYFEIENPSDITFTMDRFMELLGFQIPEGETITSSCNKEISIPGIGAEELNIRFRTPDGKKLPNLTIEITKPDGSKLNNAEKKAVYSSSDTYVMYKIHEPEAGIWNIWIDIDSKSPVTLSYDRFFNTFIGATLQVNCDPEEFDSKMTMTAKGFLSRHGQIISNPDAYLGYRCDLVLTDISTGEKHLFPAALDENNEYTAHVPINLREKWEAKVVFTSNEISTESDGQIVEVLDPAQLSCSILKNELFSIDLSEHLLELAEEKDFNVTVYDTSCEMSGISLEGNVLTIDPYVARSGSVTLRVTDIHGNIIDAIIPVYVNEFPVAAEMIVTPERSSDSRMHSNMTVSIEAYMTENGERINNPELYDGYDCSLLLENEKNGEMYKTIDLIYEETTQSFKNTEKIDYYGTYLAKIRFTNGEFEREYSELWNLENHSPELEEINAEQCNFVVPFGLFGPKEWWEREIDVSYSDLEDPIDSLTVRVEPELPGKEDIFQWDKESRKIRIPDIRKIDTDRVNIIVTDSQGASTQKLIRLTCKDNTVLYLSIAAVVLLLIIVFIILSIRKRNSYYPKGTCTVEFDVTDDDDKEVTLNVNLAPPGNGIKRKTNLYMMLNEDMMRQAGSIRAACDAENIDFSAAERFINGISSDLKNIEVSCVVGKQKDAGKIGKVKVIEGKKKDILFNSATTIRPGGHAMAFGYYLHDNNPGSDDEYNIDNPYSSSSDDDTGYGSGYSSYSSYSDDEDDF